MAQCIGRRHEPRRIEKLGEVYLATTRPSTVRARYNDPWIVEKNLNIQIVQRAVVRSRRRNAREDEVIGAISQSRGFEGWGGHDIRLHDHARILSRELFDELG